MISTVGAKFPGLHCSAGVSVEGKVLVWGGLDLENYNTIDELFVLKFKNVSTIDVEIVQRPSGISVRKLLGDIPSHRCGHTLNVVHNNIIIMHGGMQIDLTGTQETIDNDFYIFDHKTLQWQRIPDLPNVPFRAYHSACEVHINGVASIIYLGGLQRQGTTTTRHPLNELTVFKVLSSVSFHVETVHISELPSFGVSYLSSAFIDPYIFVVGGCTSEDLKGTNTITIMNIAEKTGEVINIDEQFRSAGHSCLRLSDDCLMICGGLSKQYFTYSSKSMLPGVCDLEEQCVIKNSSETSPIAWVFCEGICKRWLHQFCVGVLNKSLKGKFLCSDCTRKRQKPNKKRKV